MSDVSKTKTKTRGQRHWFVACRPRLPSAFVFGNVGISRRSRVAKSADDGRLHAGLYTCLQPFITSAPTNSITSIRCGFAVDLLWTCGLELTPLPRFVVDLSWISCASSSCRPTTNPHNNKSRQRSSALTH